jgi:hypothetical protein
MSAAYDYEIWLYLCFVFLGFMDFGLDSTRADDTKQYSNHWHIVYGFPKCNFVFFHDPDSFANAGPIDRCPLQESESALDWTGGDGWPRLGYCN